MPVSAFTVDDTYDRDCAGDRRSRFGAYLAQHRHLFTDEDTPTTSPVWFALSAWEIACSPIMAPGYVRTHGRVLTADAHGDDDGRTALAVSLAAPFPPRIQCLFGPRVRTWEIRDVRQADRWYLPYDNDRISAYTALTVRVPITESDLPHPRYHAGIPDTATAKRAVRALCIALNTVIDPVIEALNHPGAGR